MALLNNTIALADKISEFYADPLGYVMFAFPWDTDPSIQIVPLEGKYRERFPNVVYGPDPWACQFLDDLGKEISKRGFDGKHAVEPIRFSTASGHGIGKSTLVAWLIKFILDTRPFSKGMVTANTSEQLRTKTWAELAKWNGMSVTKHLWGYTSGRGSLSLYRKGDKETSLNWRCDAITCREENSEAFQGLHAVGSTPFYIFDEASGIPDKIFEARSGGSTDGEPMIFDFGNPTRKSGYFFENCIGLYKHRYKVRGIDSRTVAITNKSLIKEWEEDHGVESDFFKVKVRGVFPSAGSVQFIPSDWVKEAMLRNVMVAKNDPLIIGVDVARFGDDSTVIFPRIGRDARSFKYREYKGLDNVQVVEKVIDLVNEFKALGKRPSGIFIDGGGLGAGVVDLLRRLGYDPVDVNFGKAATSPKYRFRVDEMWGRLKDDLQHLALPNTPELMAQLTQREYGFTLSGAKIQLESKDSLHKRQIPSPDIADALALTYAHVVSTTIPELDAYPLFSNYEYDPIGNKKWAH